jgi:hypothetical protein
MAQQPNVEITEATAPRRTPQPGPAVKWRADKPGVPSGPEDVPVGGRFGTTGPDPGWALRILREVELPSDDPRLKKVVTGLVLARAAAAGRAPVREDISAALVLCGYYDGAPQGLLERRERWLDAVPHETRPGETAVGEVDRQLIVNKPDQIRYALNVLRD